MSASRDDESRVEPDVERLLSGHSGIVAGRRGRLRSHTRDALDDVALWARLVPVRLRLAARAVKPASVLVLGLYSDGYADFMTRAVAELSRSRHHVEFVLGALDYPSTELATHTARSRLRKGGKFENLNILLKYAPRESARWVLVIDDDVELPRGFLDRFLFLAERFRLQLAQPALRRTSHAAWAVCRRERHSVARRTRLVEIGPVTAFHDSVSGELMPFPALRMGWGLDLHWGGLARERGWRLGVVDAVPIRHEARAPASGYDRRAAIEELRRFLDGRPHIDRDTALAVVERFRTWR